MAQESRLVISIDSRPAEQRAADLKRALEALDVAGVRVTGNVDSMAKAIDLAGREAKSSSGEVDQFNKSVKDTDSSAATASAALGRYIKLATAGFSAMQVIDTADTWGQYASRIRMATQSAEEYDYVQGRMAASAQETFRSINETREAFINMSPVIRDMGFSLEQSIDAVDAFSGLLVVNGANAERGAAAMSALSKSLQKGKVDMDAWMTIYSTADTIVQSLALSMNKSADEVRALGIAGELTARQFVEALGGDYERIMGQVAGMPTTVRDALQNLNTAFTEYIGWNNEATGITAKLADGIVFLGDHFDMLANVAMVGVAAAAGRMAGVMAISTAGMYRSAAASIANRTASIAAAQAQVEQAAATARNAAAEVAAARAQVAFTAGTNAQVAALSRLRLARLADYEATQAQIAAQAALSRAQSVSRGLLGVLGGPAGLALTAAAAAASFLAFRDSAQQLRQPLIDLKRPAEDINDELGKMSKLKLESSIADAAGQQKQALDEMRASLVAVRGAALLPDKWGENFDSSIEQRSRAWRAFEQQIKAGIDISAATDDLIGAIKPSDDLRQSILNSALAYEEQREKAGAASDVIQMAKDAMAALTTETDINTASTGANNAAKAAMSTDGAKYLKTLQDQLGALQDNGSMVKQVERYLRDHKDATELDAVELRKAAAAIDSQREANKKAAEQTRASTKLTKDQQNELQNLTKTLVEQVSVLGMSEFEAQKYRISMMAGTDAQKQHATGMVYSLEAFSRRKAAIEMETEALLRNRNIQESLSMFREQNELSISGMGAGERRRQEMQAEFAIEQEFHQKRVELSNELTALRRNQAAQGLQIDAGVFQAREADLLAQIEQTRSTEEQKLAIQREYNQRRLIEEQNWVTGVNEALQNYVDTSRNHYQLAADATTSILNGATSSVSQGLQDMIRGTESVSDAFGNMAAGMANAVINALTEMAAQWLVYQAVQMLVGKTTQLSGASAMAANANAMALQAGLAAFASTAAIPFVGPALAPAAMATALTIATPLATAVGMTAYAGAFDKGGRIPTGQWGIVGEYGPEIVNGPANVVSRVDTARMLKNSTMSRIEKDMGGGGSSNSFSINQPMTFYGDPDQKTVAMIKRAAEEGAQQGYRLVASSLATGKGDVAKGLAMGYGVGRRKR